MYTIHKATNHTTVTSDPPRRKAGLRHTDVKLHRAVMRFLIVETLTSCHTKLHGAVDNVRLDY